MKPTDIISQLKNQGIEGESLTLYSQLLIELHLQCSIKSFKVGINSSNEPGTITSNITLITFMELGKNINLRLRLIDIIKDITQEDIEFKYLVNIDTLIISFNF